MQGLWLSSKRQCIAHRSLRAAAGVGAAAIAVACSASGASAALRTWTADTSGNWSDATKWDAAPGNGDALSFNGTAGGSVTATNDLTSGTTFGPGNAAGAILGNAMQFSGPDQFTLAGNDIKIAGNVVNTSGLLQTINLNMVQTGLTSPPYGYNVNGGSGGLLINGNIGTTTAFNDLNVQAGTGTVTLAGTNNRLAAGFSDAGSNLLITGNTYLAYFATYNGAVTVGDGTNAALLQTGVSSGGDVRFNAGLTVNNNAVVKLGAYLASGATTYTINVNGNGQFLVGTDLNIADAAGSVGSINVNGSGAKVTSGVTYIGRNGTATASLNGGTWTSTGTRIGTAGSSNGTLNVAAGTTFTSNGYVSDGVASGTKGHLNLSGTFTAGGNDFNVSDLDGSKGVLKMSGSDSSLTFGSFYAGKGGSTGGATSTIGQVNISGGTITDGGNAQIGAYGVGTLQMTGGTWNSNGGFPSIGRQSSGFGVADLSGSAVFNQNAAGSRFIVGEVGTGVLTVSNGAVLNVLSSTNASTAGSLDSDNAALTINNNNVTTADGQVNLNSGGTIVTRSIGTAGTTGRSVLNFNGGTLKVGSARTTAGSILSSNLTAAYVWSGGAVIDTNGIDSSIGKALTAPTGNGVQSITAVGTGYTAAPAVRITGGGGSGATAIAQVDSAGNLTGIVVTNPGTGYTAAPTVTLYSVDGSATTAPVALLNLGNSANGGLTKNGAGFLALNAANTYLGTTLVNAGTIGGTGSVAGPVQLASLAAVDPGTAGGGVGTFTTGDFTTGAGSALNIEVSDVNTDVLAVNGTLNLSALGDSLNVATPNLPAAGILTIATYTNGRLGTFDTTNLPQGYSIVYGPAIGAGSIQLVPEPATLAGLMGAALLGSARRRRRA